MEPYVVIEKKVGETPLAALERFRATDPKLADVPLSYAGRLDPMASGSLLILIGDECKQQARYHGLDKEYEFEVLFGVGSDTGDVLGRLTFGDARVRDTDLRRAVRSLSGTTITLPYPKFSSRTVKGTPLHVWTLEGRLNEIEIPSATTRIHALSRMHKETMRGSAIASHVLEKIETIPPVTEESKRLGADFRRDDVRADWQRFADEFSEQEFTLVRFRCVASSGTYMRSLAEHIGAMLGTSALAYSIHRTRIGRFVPLPFRFGLWLRTYR